MVVPGRFPATEPQDGSLERPPSMLDAVAGLEEPQEPEVSAEEPTEPEEPEEPAEGAEAPTDDISRLEQELNKLRQKVGTDEDVSVVKSQRDKLRNQLEQLQAQVEEHQRMLETQQQQMTQAQLQEQLASWDQPVSYTHLTLPTN